MAMISDDKVNEVRERATILDVVSDYVGLRKSGANYQGLCPFHSEKSPSFNVNPARGIFHCFGCGVGGNVFSFVMKIEGLTFPEAIRFLAKRTGVQIEDRPPTLAEQRLADERETLYRINELAAKYYRQTLLEGAAGEPGRLYLARRKVDEATSAAYRLGFASDRRDGLARHLEQRKVPLDLVEKLGLIRRREGGGYYDLFRNRLVFVITDTQGRTLGFGARVLDDSLPKYINSPESSVYRKSEVLFGADLAKQAMREEGTAIVVEGYFDHLALYQAGVRNVVATCGTALTPGHINLLRRYAERVCTLFDADAAGKKATFRAMDLFLDGGISSRVIELPPGEDPDSFLQKEGREAFDARVAKARPVLDYYFRDLLKRDEVASVEGKVRVVEELTPRLAKIGSQVERELYAGEMSRMLGVPVRSLLSKSVGRPSDPQSKPQAGVKRKQGAGPEEMLLALMVKYPEVARKVEGYGVDRLFSPDLLPVANEVLLRCSAGAEIAWDEILDQVESPEERGRLSALFISDEHLEEIDPLRAFEQCRMALERNPLRDMKSLARELARLEPDTPEYQDLLAKIDALRNRKSQLS